MSATTTTNKNKIEQDGRRPNMGATFEQNIKAAYAAVKPKLALSQFLKEKLNPASYSSPKQVAEASERIRRQTRHHIHFSRLTGSPVAKKLRKLSGVSARGYAGYDLWHKTLLLLLVDAECYVERTETGRLVMRFPPRPSMHSSVTWQASGHGAYDVERLLRDTTGCRQIAYMVSQTLPWRLLEMEPDVWIEVHDLLRGFRIAHQLGFEMGTQRALELAPQNIHIFIRDKEATL